MPVHKYLHHDRELPEALDERLDAVLQDRFVPEHSSLPVVSNRFSPEKVAQAIANQFDEYLTESDDAELLESPMADREEASGEMPTLPDAVLPLEDDVELLNESKFKILYQIMHSQGVWSIRNEGKPERELFLEIPLCLIPSSPSVFGVWAYTWNFEYEANGGGNLHFVIGPTKILAVLDSNPWYEQTIEDKE